MTTARRFSIGQTFEVSDKRIEIFELSSHVLLVGSELGRVARLWLSTTRSFVLFEALTHDFIEGFGYSANEWSEIEDQGDLDDLVNWLVGDV